MPQRRFFHPRLTEGIVELAPEEAHHAVTALRAREGDEVILFDGSGHEAVGRIARIRRRGVQVDVGEIKTFPFDLTRRITLAVAPVKAHRQSYLVEKCTELGVAAIWPIATERSVVKPAAATIAKWRRRAIEAAKQSGRRWLPVIEESQSFDVCVARFGAFDIVAMTDVGGSACSFQSFLSGIPEAAAVLVLIGPEGGWVARERESTRAAGAHAVSLSPTVLRVETAAVTVCAAAALNSVT